MLSNDPTFTYRIEAYTYTHDEREQRRLRVARAFEEYSFQLERKRLRARRMLVSAVERGNVGDTTYWAMQRGVCKDEIKAYNDLARDMGWEKIDVGG